MIYIRFKQDLEMTFKDCIENCEDQGCASNCRRDFYIKIDCKFSTFILSNNLNWFLNEKT